MATLPTTLGSGGSAAGSTNDDERTRQTTDRTPKRPMGSLRGGGHWYEKEAMGEQSSEELELALDFLFATPPSGDFFSFPPITEDPDAEAAAEAEAEAPAAMNASSDQPGTNDVSPAIASPSDAPGTEAAVSKQSDALHARNPAGPAPGVGAEEASKAGGYRTFCWPRNRPGRERRTGPQQDLEVRNDDEPTDESAEDPPRVPCLSLEHGTLPPQQASSVRGNWFIPTRTLVGLTVIVAICLIIAITGRGRT